MPDYTIDQLKAEISRKERELKRVKQAREDLSKRLSQRQISQYIIYKAHLEENLTTLRYIYNHQDITPWASTQTATIINAVTTTSILVATSLIASAETSHNDANILSPDLVAKSLPWQFSYYQ